MRFIMTNEMLKTYTARITQASQSELVVILYDIILEDIKSAQKADQEGEKELVEAELKHGQKFLQELMGTLDFSYSIAHDLMNLYIYVNQLLLTSIIKKQDEELDTATFVLTKLKEGFLQISKEDTSGPVMQNTQQIYAGLTYGKGVLNETSLNNYNDRGFKA